LESWPKEWGFGLGTRFGMSAPFYVNLDALQVRVYDKEFFDDDKISDTTFLKDEGRVAEHSRQHSNYLFKARLGLNYAPIRYLAVSGGAYANCLLAGRDGEFKIDAPENMSRDYKIGKHGAKMRVWPGLYAGVTAGIVRR
jgi:hypothetical protein